MASDEDTVTLTWGMLRVLLEGYATIKQLAQDTAAQLGEAYFGRHIAQLRAEIARLRAEIADLEGKALDA